MTDAGSIMIREERAADAGAIRQLVTDAFRRAPHATGTEAGIVDALRAAGALTLSLIAAGEGGGIVGHVAFSPVEIEGEKRGWYGLGPLAVLPARQRHGIGAALVRCGIARLEGAGADGVTVLGDPVYYRRFGFRAHSALRFPGAPAEYFMSLTFGSAIPSGTVAYHAAFSAS